MKRISRRIFIHTSAALAGAGLVSDLSERVIVPLAAQSQLPRRLFGQTGVRVTIVGLGGGGRFFEPIPDDQQGADLVRQAIERGVEFIETGANYGPEGDTDQAERRIGLAMKTHRKRVFLETKTDARDYSGAMREMERSLKLLNTDHIDLMLHHNLGRPTDLDKITGADGAEKAMRKLVDQKAVRFHGFSCHNPALTLQAMERLEPDAIQAPINATAVPDFEAEVLPLAKKKGVAVIAMKVVGHGFFLKEAIGGAFDSRFKTDRNPGQHRFAPPPEAFDQPHPSPPEFLLYALALPITTALVGIDSLATLGSVIKAISPFSPLTSAQAQEIRQRAQVFSGTGYWIPRARPA